MESTLGTDRPRSVRAGGDNSNGNRVLQETELDSALQLLVERAQYITGATGAALALPQGEEMVCRASAGSSAPGVGARLQVRSGLTGESIARRQLLRCDNAETDPRVNLETCQALGIASIVVLPLLRRSGEVRGLFELFSDHPYAFEERDLIALERMADLTLTALDLAEQRQNIAPVPIVGKGQEGQEAEKGQEGQEPERPTESPTASSAGPASVVSLHALDAAVTEPTVVISAEGVPAAPDVISLPAPTAVPEAMRRVQKCSSCGFPVSEGRTLCLDCEKKDSQTKQRQKEQGQAEQKIGQQQIDHSEQEQDALSATASAAQATEEFVPAFLANAAPVSESWLANHVNLLAVIVLILGILVAVVVFR